MKRILLYLFIAGLALTGNSCKKTRPTYTDTQVRILNATAWTFTDCTIDPFGTLSINPGPYAYNYGQVNVGGICDYHAFPQIYRYAWVRLTMNNKVYYLHPFDYIGEIPLANGRYTYKLSYVTAGDNLFLELIND